MDAIGIVEVLNNKLESMKCKKGIHFILHKKIDSNSFSKAYKTYEYVLWYINGKERIKTLRMEHTARVVTEKEEEKTIKELENQLLMSIFNLLQDPINFNTILNGEFKGFNSD